jgi:hypothetical protein
LRTIIRVIPIAGSWLAGDRSENGAIVAHLRAQRARNVHASEGRKHAGV